MKSPQLFSVILLFLGCSSPDNPIPSTDESVITGDTSSIESGRRQLDLVTGLDDALIETSGLLIIDGMIFTHNDSGGQPSLYKIDKLSGSVADQFDIANSVNRDWEDIARDADYIFIGDIGNNNGDRDDLTIYKIRISDITGGASNSITAEEIHFSYSDQKDFQATPYGTKYDAEALVSIGDSLFIFTKNWTENRTYVYSVPKEPGLYEVSIRDSLNVPGLVTAADYDPSTEKLFLLGYGFIVEIQEVTSGTFSSGSMEVYSISVPAGYSGQTEGVIQAGNQIYISAEAFSGVSQALYRLDINN